MDGSRTGSNVFVSYSRVDGDFVRHLTGALRESGRDSWVDWEGIAPSAEWMVEIREAIEAADTFVFVMSPDSLGSTVCNEELEHAITTNKRIVPVVHRDADGIAVPGELAKRNWLFFRESDDFRGAFAALIEAIDTDLEAVKFHTGLLIRSREWEKAGEPRTKLLRGADLTEAERWESSPDRTLPPTEQQHRYVLASRQAASRRQRLGLAAVAGVMVLSLALTSLALIQRSRAVDAQSRAERERDRAEEQTRSANSRAVAAQALVQLEREPDLAALLSVEAYRVAPTQEALDVMQILVQRSAWVDAVRREHDHPVWTLDVAEDGRTFATAGADGQVIIGTRAPKSPPSRP